MKNLFLIFLFFPLTTFGQQIEYVNSENHKASEMPFSQATIVNGIVYLSGQIGEINNSVVKGGIDPETTQALTNIKNVLEEMGLSIDDIFKCTCMMSDIKDCNAHWFSRESMCAIRLSNITKDVLELYYSEDREI